MKNSNILVALAASFALIGCSGGSGNNNVAPTNTTTTYNIYNKTQADFKTVSIVDNKTGAVTQTASLNCASQETGCVFHYMGPAFENGETLLFKDGNDQLVSAYVSSLEHLPYEDVIVTPWYTGLYLYKELNKRNATIAAMPQDVIEAKLNTFTLNYDSPDGADDFYEEIAAYYAHKLATPQLTLSTFLDDFAQRLINGEIADASEFNQFIFGASPLRNMKTVIQNVWNGKEPLLRPAMAEDSGGCPAAVGWFLGVYNAVASGVQNAFPLAGTVASSVGSLASSACGSSEPSLADIMNKLNQIQGAIDALRDDLAKLSALVADTNLNEALSRFGKVVTESQTLGGQYSGLLNSSSAKSLLGYVQKTGNGTLGDVLNKYPGGALDELMSSVLGKQKLVNDIRALTDEKFKTMLQSIQTKCGNITVGDIVSTRVQCNLVVNESMARLLASQKIALKIANEVYEVADAFPAEAGHRWGYDGNRAQAFAKLKKQFDDQLLFAKNSYESTIINSDQNQKGYYNAYDGLPSGLAENMKNAICWNYTLDVPAIGKWIKEKNGNTEYIETNCHVGSKDRSTALARYFFKLDGANVGNADVANVLGVLVEKRYVTGQDLWYVGSRYTYLEMLKNPRVALKLSGEDPVSYWSAINNTNSRNTNVVGVKSDEPAGGLIRSSDSAPSFPWYFTLYNVNGSHDYKLTWIRVTDASNFSYVFNLATKAENSGRLFYYLYCVTGDCTPDKSISGTVGFAKGPAQVFIAQRQGSTDQDPYTIWVDGKY